MKKSKLILATAAVVLMAALAGCGKSADNPSPNDPNTPVADPEGTMTANISQTTEIGIQSCGNIRWTTPNNFNLVGYATAQNSGVFSICDLGAMRGLGNITSIPQSGYIDGGGSIINSAAACEVGHGYVIKAEYQGSVWSTTYVRLYVEESIISTDGGIMGAKVKYQYPFTPSCTVTFNSNGGSAVDSQTVDGGSSLYEPARPTKAGYTFGGWYADNNTFASPVIFPYIVTADITLYAKWIGDVIVRTADDLNAVRNNLSLSYSLANDISLAGYSNWLPIGTEAKPFYGKFNGNGHKITGLTINSTTDDVGLFGCIYGGSVSNLGVEIAAGGVNGNQIVGGIAGSAFFGGTINNCYSTGNISSSIYSGGIVGLAFCGTITNCYSTGNISSSSCSGGIAGYIMGGGKIINCAAINPTIISTGTPSYAGCIVGYIDNTNGTNKITNNFALSTMTVTGDQSYGNSGVGKTDAQLKTQSTYSGAVSGDGLGGLGWDFGTTWKMPAGGGYPVLYWQ